MALRHSRSNLRAAYFNRSPLGRRLAAAIERAHPELGPLLLGLTLGRVVVLVRTPELASAPTEHQVAVATRVAAATRTHLAGDGWWARLLTRTAVVVAFEADEVRGGCAVSRYAECVVPVAVTEARLTSGARGALR